MRHSLVNQLDYVKPGAGQKRKFLWDPVIDQYNLPWPQRRSQYVFDVAGKRRAIGPTRQLHAWTDPTRMQRGDDGLIGWCVARNAATSALTNWRTSIAPCQVQIAAEFVHDHKIVCILVGDLDLKGGASPGVAQKGAQTLFFRETRSRAIARLMVQREREAPCSCVQLLTCSGKVASGEALS